MLYIYIDIGIGEHWGVGGPHANSMLMVYLFIWTLKHKDWDFNVYKGFFTYIDHFINILLLHTFVVL